MKLDIIHHNVTHWRTDKNLLKRNPDIITINSHGLDSTKGQFLKLFTYSNKTTSSGMATGAAILTKIEKNFFINALNLLNKYFLQISFLKNSNGKKCRIKFKKSPYFLILSLLFLTFATFLWTGLLSRWCWLNSLMHLARFFLLVFSSHLLLLILVL